MTKEVIRFPRPHDNAAVQGARDTAGPGRLASMNRHAPERLLRSCRELRTKGDGDYAPALRRA
jgi:hypothetical protein